VLVALSFVTLPFGCFERDPEGTKRIVLISTDDEIAMGRGVAREVEKQHRLSKDPALTRRVEAMGEGLATFSGRTGIEYTFRVIDDDDLVNAFAAPGGWVYVTTGLLETVASDDELACVIGHEIAHVAAKHSVMQFQSRAIAAGVLTVVSGILVGQADTAADERRARYVLAGIAVGADLTFLKYSRSQESQSDRLGMRYALLAGFDPAGMVVFLERLAKTDPQRPGFAAILRTHPVSEVRISDARRHLAQLPSEHPEAWRRLKGAPEERT
jgi:predicted Zn-dependent protease